MKGCAFLALLGSSVGGTHTKSVKETEGNITRAGLQE